MTSLIQQLINQGYLKTPEIISAFRRIKREDFTIPELKHEAEQNYPLSIGYQQTISQPLTVAFMLELLDPHKGHTILDVGSGSGWTTALLSEIVGEDGNVYALERIPELTEFGEDNTRKYNFVASKRAVFITGDGSKGLKEKAPFDRIHVAAAAPKVPKDLCDQLKIGGKLVIPEGADMQNIVLIEKVDKHELRRQEFPGFAFVPLVSDKK
ncbi:protein-L-isoaspartate O-methyltransferase [Patescibacteria group bacterium AH-259-L05]|nr:protein-L-isoaspartate O-methyltransferase [Patescibacteria group bacterium AH-259-L05]